MKVYNFEEFVDEDELKNEIQDQKDEIQKLKEKIEELENENKKLKNEKTKKPKKEKISNGEKMVNEILVELFSGYKFTKVRPSWLKNDITGKNLELDFYCKELKLAFEFQGKQHYDHTPFFHGSGEVGDKNYAGQMQRDFDKKKICKGHDITLIEIKYDENREEIYQKIKKIKDDVIFEKKKEEEEEEEEEEEKIPNQTISSELQEVKQGSVFNASYISFMTFFINNMQINSKEYLAGYLFNEYIKYCEINNLLPTHRIVFYKNLAKKYERKEESKRVYYKLTKN